MRRPWLPALAVALLTIPVCSRLERAPVAASCLRVLPPLGVMPDGTGADLPTFPKLAPSPLGPIPVRLVVDLQCGGKPALGCFHYNTRLIEIRDSLPLVTSWLTLRHELAHSAFYHAGVVFDDPNAENRVADAIANQQVMEMLGDWPRHQ